MSDFYESDFDKLFSGNLDTIKLNQLDIAQISYLSGKINKYWFYLETTYSEWISRVEEIESDIINFKSNEKIDIKRIIAHAELCPYSERHILTYVTFFWTLHSEIYKNISKNLNKINEHLKLKTKKKPKLTKYLKALEELRNIYAVHPGDSDKKEKSEEKRRNSRAWLCRSGENLKYMTSFQLKIDGRNIEINLIEIHEKSKEYLIEYDNYCYDFLNKILNRII